MTDGQKLFAGLSGTIGSLELSAVSNVAALTASVLTAGFMLACLVEKLRKNHWFPFGRWPFGK